jgi:hypothetical protein
MIHTVLFWLKPEATADERANFAAELERLTRISYLARGFAGTPAATEARPVTDHSFDFMLSLEFKSMEDHEFYQKDCPDHKRFVDLCKPLFDRVVVYDARGLA